MLTLMQLIDDKVEQLLAGRPIRARKRQDIALQPPGKCTKVVRLLMRPCFERTKFGKPGDDKTILTASTGLGSRASRASRSERAPPAMRAQILSSVSNC
jgi:hypothetical protein